MPYASDPSGLLRLLPPIRRARLWRLYAEDGGRFLDLWSDCSRSVLGAKGTGLGTQAKAAVDMGLTRAFPSVWERRLEKALLAAHPGWAAARFYSSDEAALAALGQALGRELGQASGPGFALADPGRREAGGAIGTCGAIGAAAAVAVLRPFAEALPPPPPGALAALPLLPCPASLAPSALLFRDEETARAAGGELLPPLLLACATRALAELVRFSAVYREESWRRVDRRLAPRFERLGPWLYPRCAEAEYEAFFRSALSSGVLLSPAWDLPSLVPGDFDDGELAALSRALE